MHIAGATHQAFAHFGQGTEDILLDDVMCIGTESSLLDCEYDANTIDCGHFEDAGVTCAESIGVLQSYLLIWFVSIDFLYQMSAHMVMFV